MPLIAKREFASRRNRLMKQMPANSLAVIAASSLQTRSGDTHYRFRQHSDFLYLTGFNEPDAILVLVPRRAKGETIIFCRDPDAEYQRWNGEVLGPEQAEQKLGVDHGFGLDAFTDIAEGLLEGIEQIYAPLDNATITQALPTWQARYGTKLGEQLLDIQPLIADLRWVKSSAELRAMGAAATISSAAMNRAIEATRPGLWEYQIAAELHHTYLWHGAEAAYLPIVAAGQSAEALHYVDNQRELRDGDLLLVDAGCEVEGYAADITRTWPISGQFNSAQRAIYQLVLAANEAAIAEVVMGNPYDAAHQAAVKMICHGLVQLKIIDGPVDEALKQQRYKKYFMHATGHWVGLDVHDTGPYKVAGQSPVLEDGMVVTVEPGIYIDSTDQTVAPKWRGIAVRIEDTVAVSQNGPRVLTSAAIKQIDQIETAMRETDYAPV